MILMRLVINTALKLFVNRLFLLLKVILLLLQASELLYPLRSDNKCGHGSCLYVGMNPINSLLSTAFKKEVWLILPLSPIYSV